MGVPDAVANAQQYCGACERKGAFRVAAGSPAGRRRLHPSVGPAAARSTVLFVRERLNRRAPWLIRPLETRPGFARGRERAPACDAIACTARRFPRAMAKTVAFASAEVILPQPARKCAIGSVAGRLLSRSSGCLFDGCGAGRRGGAPRPRSRPSSRSADGRVASVLGGPGARGRSRDGGCGGAARGRLGRSPRGTAKCLRI